MHHQPKNPIYITDNLAPHPAIFCTISVYRHLVRIQCIQCYHVPEPADPSSPHTHRQTYTTHLSTLGTLF